MKSIQDWEREMQEGLEKVRGVRDLLERYTGTGTPAWGSNSPAERGLDTVTVLEWLMEKELEALYIEIHGKT